MHVNVNIIQLVHTQGSLKSPAHDLSSCYHYKEKRDKTQY